MARVASLLKRASVRIAMAVGAVCECQSGVARLTILPGRMTALALNVSMFARKRELCLGVVEAFLADGRFFPVHGRMAPYTFGAQASLMFILMTIATALREPQPGPIQIFASEQ